MIKEIRQFILISVLAVCLCACGSEAPADTAAAETTPAVTTSAEETTTPAETTTAATTEAVPESTTPEETTTQAETEPVTEGNEPASDFDFTTESLFLSISGETFELPVDKAEFESGNVSLDDDLYGDGGLYRMGFMGKTFHWLLIDCRDDQVTGIRLGWNTISEARKEAIIFNDGDMSKVPDITINGLSVGMQLSEDQFEDLKAIADDYYESTAATMTDDDTEYTKVITIQAITDDSVVVMEICFNDDLCIMGIFAQRILF